MSEFPIARALTPDEAAAYVAKYGADAQFAALSAADKLAANAEVSALNARERLYASVAEQIRRDNAEAISRGAWSFACPYCGDWLPTPAGYASGFAVNDSHVCGCGKTRTRRP
jgi:hypothetical protein